MAAEAAFDAVADAEVGFRDQSQGDSSSADASVSEVSEVAPKEFEATESVMQLRPYFGGVMVAYVAGLSVAFAVRYIAEARCRDRSTPQRSYCAILWLSAVLVRPHMGDSEV